tara:strand:+ start:740 stop:2584 length:1845 start_codon:yes stop_codon:yes gene_type:complete
MDRDYNTHLCTFMGRETNLKILLPYIEGALLNNAVDNYWFIDMTRKISDHELIIKEHKRLNDMFPGRVHIHNSEARSKIINDKDAIKKASESWEVFYSFLNQFTDNDIIAKCDDDVYYIDIQTLSAAYKLRWDNKKPYIMHANCINNGLTAYYQNKKGIWTDKESSTYPEGGLTGQLFTKPQIACQHHKQFTKDIMTNSLNIKKYKLNKNITFTDRVSINFVFFNGKDRHELSKITKQDEYDISSKYPQREDRPNLIIGDFTVAHHTYGPQEPVMEQLNTYECYRQLCNKLDPAHTEVEHMEITTETHATTTITRNGAYLMKSWTTKNSYVLRDPETNKYISLKHVTPEGNLHTGFSRTDNIKDATLFDLDINQPSRMEFTKSAHLVKTPSNDKHDQDLTFPFPLHYQDNYEKMTVNVTKLPSGKYVIRPHGNFQHYSLAPADKCGEDMWKKDPEAAKHLEGFMFWKKDTAYEWGLVPMGKFNNKPVPGIIDRQQPFDKYETDSTEAWTSYKGHPFCSIPRESIWMVNEYIYELIHVKDNKYHVKLITSHPGKYLFYDSPHDSLFYGQGPDEWEFVDQSPKYLKHVKTGKYLNIVNNEWCMVDEPTELAMCPLK